MKNGTEGTPKTLLEVYADFIYKKYPNNLQQRMDDILHPKIYEIQIIFCNKVIVICPLKLSFLFIKLPIQLIN